MGVAFESQAPPSQSENGPRPPRPPRPNYNKLHAQPLPVKAYPLPPLIPHNPLSILHVAFIYLSHVIFPPSSHPQTLLSAYVSADTRSFHVTDEKTARILWEQGFFGKGSLSRSEPAWLEREKIRQGLVLGDTSEEITRKRREERKQFKNERARLEREAIEEKLAEEATDPTKSNGHIEPSVVSNVAQIGSAEETDSRNPASISANVPLEPTSSLETDEPIAVPSSEVASDISSLQPPQKILINQEHLQLTTEEALFLVYALGVLEIRDPITSQPISTSRLFSICRSHSYFPPQPSPSHAPDDPFLLSYVAYHHFRSLGWVVRPGIKFGVDHLLYNRGPVFTHAEFAVIVLPAYTDASWSSTVELQAAVKKKTKKSWWWLHCVNRVQAQVKKTLLLAYVEVPPPVSGGEGITNEAGDVMDVGRFLKRYKVRELILKRWTLNRNKE
ncbi:MAG: hypothetical protein L6R38_008252 [Xanthoria sp. 2 TBL-2021]|nr:MAG: hypothetical protein L6R38_008252 [Xanthoria sp. 2 TBL-2021]